MTKLGVSHDPSDFTEAQTILTLEDKPLLDEKGRLNEDPDVLHNANMREAEVAKRNCRRRAKQSDFEDKFGDGLLMSAANILPQYGGGEDPFSREKFSVAVGLTESIGDIEPTVVNETNAAALKELRRKSDFASDYFTAAELYDATAAEQRPKLRRRRKAAEDAVPADAPKGGLGVVSRASRRRKAEPAAAAEAEAPRAEGLRALRERERSETRLTLQRERALSGMAQVADVDADDEEDLRRVRLIERSGPATRIGAEALVQKVERELRAQPPVHLIKPELGREYDETADFVSALDFDAQKARPIKTEPPVAKAERGATGAPVKAEFGGLAQNAAEEGEAPERGASAAAAMASEPLASESISAALQLFRLRGHLAAKERGDFVGRSNDEKPRFFAQAAADVAGVRLEHLDPRTGRPLTRKQAFRNLSHVFHGQKPADYKRAKESRVQKTLRKRRAPSSTETPTGLVAKTQAITKKAGVAFVPLDQNRNAAVAGILDDFEKFEKLGRKAGGRRAAKQRPTKQN